MHKMCGRPIREDIFQNPVEILGDLLQRSIAEVDDRDLCKTCKEELCVLNLLRLSDETSFQENAEWL